MKSILRALTLLALAGPALAGNYVGDYNVGDTVDCNFGTVNPSTGASFTLAGTPVISAYIDNSTTELTAGITLTADFDARTGMNHVRVAATGGNGYAAGTFVSLVITTGTVNSISVVGQEVCSFTLRKGTITGIPAATAGASGGILISGTNAGTTTLGALTVTGTATISDGLVVNRSTSNATAATFTGNGTGNGVTITSGAGATGTGLAIASGATNGAGATITGTGTGNGATFTSGAGATGNGLSAVAASTNGNGINTAGTGTGSGELDTGGATGHGIRAVGGATSGSGLSAVASTSGSGIVATGVGTTQPGIAATGGSTSSAGISATGGGTGSGILATSGAGATGNGIQATAASTNGSAIGVTPTGTGLVFSTPANANVTQYGGSAGTFSSGRPEVNTTVLAGTSLATLTGAYPSLGIIDSGTAQAATGTTLQIRSAATFADNELTGASCIITGGTTGIGQSRTVSSNVGSTDTLTVPTWTTTPTGTITYVCYGTAAGSGSAAPTVAQIATAVWQDTTSGDFTTASSIGKSLYTTGATPGASGGLQIAGSNAATSYADFDVTANASFAGGVTITQSSSNTPALVVTGNGTGNGATFTSGSGATGNGIQATAASTNGSGFGLTATGTGVTMTMTPANAIQIAGQTTSAAGSVAFPTTVASTTNITSATGITVATNSDKTGYTLSSAGINAFADTSTTGHTTGGTWGGAWNAAGAAGDPWSTALPGGYAAGTAGNIVGNRIDAAITSRLAPTVAARTLDVSAGGEAGLDWANIGSPTTSVNLSSTTISTTQGVASVSGNVGGNVTGNVTGSVGTVNALATGALNSIRDIQVEDMGGGVTSACVQSVLLSFAAGDIVTTSGSTVWKDPSNGETRITSTVTSNGNRTATITCPTLP